jgi:type III restriction enzyme
VKLEFDPNLDYQLAAIDSTIALFQGQQKINTNLRFTKTQTPFAVVPNKLTISEEELLRNLNQIQKDNKITPDEELVKITETINGPIGKVTVSYPNFSIEMETGTGKTYVYFRTIIELNQHYGYRKFVIVVPSIAIKEGVLKTYEITKDHFKQLYGKPTITCYEYDSSKLSQVSGFTRSSDLEIMVMTLASFNKASNIINRTMDQLQGETPIQLLQETRPILILDEPQNMESEKSIRAISSMNPLFTLRYSATHRNPYNIIYRLTPYEAYRKMLVKRVEVASIVQEASKVNPYILLKEIDAKKKTIRAKLVVHKLLKSGVVKERTITVNPEDSLVDKTNREEYQGFEVSEINPGGGFIRFANNVELNVGEEIGVDKDALFEAQIRYTVEEHFRKQERLKDNYLKVLSLFFIDRVANYADEEGIIRKLFNQAFNELKQKYPEWKDKDPEQVQAAYFAQRTTREGKTILEDSKTGEAQRDEEAYNLIMRNKEQLLSLDEPVSFIFSHSALREGWDNPNIYQICTLNQTASEIKKRQEIGRGIRLAVNQEGQRVHDERLNILTVVANESYESYVSQYQTEIMSEYREEIEARYGKSIFDLTETERDEVKQEYGEDILPLNNARKKKTVKLDKARQLSPEFKEIWNKIKHKTKYRVTIDSEQLVNDVSEQMEHEEISAPRITIHKAMVQANEENIFEAIETGGSDNFMSLVGRYPIPNVVDKIINQLEYTSPPVRLTRKTILDIIKNLSTEKQKQMMDNPIEFSQKCSQVIKEKIADQLVAGIQYTKIGEWYEMKQFYDEYEIWEEYLIPVKGSIYDYVKYDSNIEKDFVEGLERNKQVLLYFKLPPWFKVLTPIGGYNPDWAILWQERDEHGQPTDKKLYLVVETKGTNRLAELREEERRKILCGFAHFKETLKIDGYKLAKDINDIP